jgi:hypothetical protein
MFGPGGQFEVETPPADECLGAVVRIGDVVVRGFEVGPTAAENNGSVHLIVSQRDCDRLLDALSDRENGNTHFRYLKQRQLPLNSGWGWTVHLPSTQPHTDLPGALHETGSLVVHAASDRQLRRIKNIYEEVSETRSDGTTAIDLMAASILLGMRYPAGTLLTEQAEHAQKLEQERAPGL